MTASVREARAAGPAKEQDAERRRRRRPGMAGLDLTRADGARGPLEGVGAGTHQTLAELSWFADATGPYGAALGDLPVVWGPPAAEALSAAGAAGAVHAGTVVLPGPDAPPTVALHEAGHAAGPQGNLPGAAPAAAPAERVASLPWEGASGSVQGDAFFRLVRDPLHLRPRQAPGEGAVAVPEAIPEPPATADVLGQLARELRGALLPGGRAEGPTGATGEAAVAEVAGDAAGLDGASFEAPGLESAGVETAGAETAGLEEEAATKAGSEDVALEDVALEDAPAAEAAMNPDAGTAETAPAEASATRGTVAPTETSGALEGASSAEGALAAFVDVAPSTQAALMPELGAALTSGATAETEAFAAAQAPLKGTLPGPTTAPAVDTDRLQATFTPAATPELPVAPTVTIAEAKPQGAVSAPGVADAFADAASDATAAEKAERAQAALATPPALAVETSPGPAPEVPREGAADPAAVQDVAAQGNDAAARVRAEAAAAIAAGPGPEVVVALADSAETPLPTLTTPEPAPPPDVAGMAELRALPLEPEVQAAFDVQMEATTAAKRAEAQDAADAAALERDTARQEAATTAGDELTALQDEQEAERQRIVGEQQTAITDAQSETAADQERALAEADSELTERASADQQAVKDRFEADEGQIGARYAKAETDAESASDQKQAEAEKERKAAQKDAGDESLWDKAVSFAKGFLDAYLSAIKAILSALQEAVGAILDAARDFAKTLIDAAVSFASALVAAYASFAKALIDGLIGSVFPELAAALGTLIDGAVALATDLLHAVGEALKAGVDVVADGLKAAVDAAVGLYTAALDAVVGTLQAALSGDWDLVFQRLLEAALSLAGIPPESFWELVGRAEETWQRIVEDPGAFLRNLGTTVVTGFQQFGDNAVDHLIKGFIAWVTGGFPVPLELPEKWDLWGILDVGRQIVGLSLANLERVARTVVGDTAVDVFLYVTDKVKTLIDQGWAAFFEEIKGEISSLAGQIIPDIAASLALKLAEAAIPWLLAFVDISGISAIVKVLQTAWGIYQFLRDQLQRMIGIVQSVVESIENIAKGVLEPAANRVEQTMEDLIPVLLDLVAKGVPFDLVAPIRKAVDKVQAAIERAAKKLFLKFKKMFSKKGGNDDGKVGAFDGEVGEALTFKAGDEGHRLWVETKGRGVHIKVASTPMTVTERLKNWRGRLKEAPNEASGQGGPSDAKRALTLLPLAEKTLAATQTVAEKAIVAPTPEGRAKDDQATERKEGELAGILDDLFALYQDSSAGALQQLLDEIARKAHPNAVPELQQGVKAISADPPATFGELDKKLTASGESNAGGRLLLKPSNKDVNFGKIKGDKQALEAVKKAVAQYSNREKIPGLAIDSIADYTSAQKANTIHHGEPLKAFQAEILGTGPEVGVESAIIKAIHLLIDGAKEDPNLTRAEVTAILEYVAGKDKPLPEEVTKNLTRVGKSDTWACVFAT